MTLLVFAGLWLCLLRAGVLVLRRAKGSGLYWDAAWRPVRSEPFPDYGDSLDSGETHADRGEG